MKRIPGKFKEAKIAGVCAGIAYNFKLPVLLVRVLFFAGLFCGSLAFWLYILLWILMDEYDKVPDDYDEVCE